MQGISNSCKIFHHFILWASVINSLKVENYKDYHHHQQLQQQQAQQSYRLDKDTAAMLMDKAKQKCEYINLKIT